MLCLMLTGFDCQCVTKATDSRPKAATLVDHPFVKGARENSVLLPVIAETMQAIKVPCFARLGALTAAHRACNFFFDATFFLA